MPRGRRKRGGKARSRRGGRSSQHVVEWFHGNIGAGVQASFTRQNFNSVPAGRPFRIASVSGQVAGYSQINSTSGFCSCPAAFSLQISRPGTSSGSGVVDTGTQLVGSAMRRFGLRSPPSTDWYPPDTTASTPLLLFSNICFAVGGTPMSLAYCLAVTVELGNEDEAASCPTLLCFPPAPSDFVVV